jgi:ribokinase
VPNQRSPVIAVVGSANIDLVAYTPRIPGPGETVIGDRFVLSFGGKGANQAAMARRVGAQVWLVARVGEDAYGRMTIADLEAAGIETRYVEQVPGPTGVAPIWVEPDGTNRIVVIPGANHAWRTGDADAAVRAIPDLDVVVGQLEIPQAVTAEAFEAAKRRGAVTLLNPAPAAPLIPELLAATEWIIPNEAELSALANDIGSTAATLEERVAAVVAAARAGATGARLVVTLGANGALVVRGDGSLAHVSAPAVDAVDTTGAGDAFIGSFAVAIAEGLDELVAVGNAVRFASDSVTLPGARGSRVPPDAWRNAYSPSASSQPSGPGRKGTSST